MPTTTNVKQIKLHRMTKSQYDSATKNANEFYVTKDEAIDYNDLVNTPDLATVATSGSYNDLTNKPNLSTVATSGNYNDLSNKPTIGTGTLTIKRNNTTVDTFNANATTDKTINITVPTTASEIGGIVANLPITGATYTKITYDSKGLVTSGTDIVTSDITDIRVSATEINRLSGVASNVQTQINTINGKIPSAATTSNQLADKAFVNSSINAVAAYYITSNAAGAAFATHAALVAGPYYYDGATRTPTKNDYAIVTADEDHSNACTRYSYTGTQWAFQYVVNDTPFTQAQLDAINSGITSTLVSTFSNKQDAITGAASTITSSDLTASKALVSDTNGKVAVSSVTSTELGYVSGVTSAIQTQLNNKQATLVSGTNIKTINSTSLLGSGNISITGLPSQTSQSGKFLTTNGTTASWANVPTEIPSQTGNSGKFLTTDGSAVSWATVDALPSQTSQSGKFLTTNGTTASWANVPTEIPSQSGNSGKYLTTNGTTVSWNTISQVPSQTGNSGKFLTTNGTTASWASLATVATSGSYNDLSNKLTAGTGISITNNAISTDRTIVTFVEWS